MKSNLTALEIHYLVNELQFLVGSRVDNVYHPFKDEIILQLHASGKRILRIISGKLFYLASEKEPASEPSGFCMFLRKHIGNLRLKGITQIGSERIVEFFFEGKKLIIEFFGKGNILLCDKDGVILSALVYHKWKDREIRAKLKYSYPKMEYDFFNLKLRDLKEIFKKSGKDLIKCLATEVGLGGVYSEEVCLLAKADKKSKTGELKEDTIGEIFGIIGGLINREPKAFIVYEKGVRDIVPIDLKVYGEMEKKEFKTYNEAFDYYFLNEEERPKTERQKRIEKLNRIIENQKETIGELMKKEVEERRKGELIYQNYQLVNEIITEIKKALGNHDWKEIEKRLKGHKVIKAVNSRDKTLEIEI